MVYQKVHSMYLKVAVERGECFTLAGFDYDWYICDMFMLQSFATAFAGELGSS